MNSLKDSEIYIKQLQIEDVSQKYANWLNDHEVNKYLESKHVVHDIDSVTNYVKSFKDQENKKLFGVFLNEDDSHLGNITLSEINWRYKYATIGICIGRKDFWGRGIGLRALKLAIKYCFEELHLHRLEAGVHIINVASLKLFKKAGFAIEGTLKDRSFIENEYVDGIWFGLINPND